MSERNDWVSWLSKRIAIAWVVIFAVLIPVVWLQGCGDSGRGPRPKPPPAPFFTSNVGQMWVKVPKHDIEWWCENHKDANIIAISTVWDSTNFLVVYEEAGDGQDAKK